MKNFRLSALLCCVSLCGFAACSNDKTDDQPEPQAYQVTQFESSTIPASIPGEGGGDKLTFVIRTETRSTGATFEPWAYRLTLGDAVGDAVTVTKPTTEIAITIPPNRSKEERGVAVEMASGVKAETWTKIVEATQEGSLKDYQVTKFESTTIPATIPAGGGDYDVLFRLEVETRAAAPLFVAWQYRVTLGDAVGDAVEVTEPTEKIAGSLKTGDALSHMFPFKQPEAVKKTLTFELEKAAEAETRVKINFDEAYVAEYNYLNKTKFVAFPEASVAIANDGILTIAAGATSGSIEVTLSPNPTLSTTEAYMAPLQAVAQSANVTVKTDASRVNFTIKQQGSKTVKNFLYFEVNDTNPLNALEYVLEDGQLFFDAVVLFSGNIHWDTQSGKPYMHYNDNVTALLKDKDKYIQPLRDRGIKVLMGVLGDHDGSGPGNLTEKGAEVFAEHLAEMCVEYGLDGICMDDEYSEYYKAPTNEYFTGYNTSLQQATYFLERVNYYMKKEVPWETMTAVFYWGLYNSSMPAINGRQPAEFVDMVNANYGGSASPVAGGDKSMCSFMSVECNLGSGWISEDSARQAKEAGYGWCMWFALDPVLRREPWSKLSAAAKGLYDQDLKPRTGYYKKLGEGRYDPTRYEN